MYYVFYVLTSNRVHEAHNSEGLMWSRFDPVAIDFFNRIHDTYQNVEFVCSSTWRKLIDDTDRYVPHWVESALRNSGFRGNFAQPWRTEDFVNESTLSARAKEVTSYIKRYTCDDFIVFDDVNYMWKEYLPAKRFVRTSTEDGLLHKHMLYAKSLMGQWKSKNKNV